MKQIFLYGLASVVDQYRVVAYSFVDEEHFSIRNLNTYASWLRMHNPTIEHVYAIDARHGLKNQYMNTVKKNSVEGNVIFKCMLEKEGLLII